MTAVAGGGVGFGVGARVGGEGGGGAAGRGMLLADVDVGFEVAFVDDGRLARSTGAVAAGVWA